jgi:hypothetical protein
MRYVWVQGTREEIEETIHDLRANGFSFQQGEAYELKSPCHWNAPLSCSLRDFCAPSIPSPQPRPWDAVLGGSN